MSRFTEARHWGSARQKSPAILHQAFLFFYRITNAAFSFSIKIVTLQRSAPCIGKCAPLDFVFHL